MQKNDYVVLEKIEDRRYGGNHPNGVNIGSREVQGFVVDMPEVGKQFYLYDKMLIVVAWTSVVESFTDEQIVTKNSIYSIEIKK